MHLLLHMLQQLSAVLQVQYTRKALAYLNNEPSVERYAWFTSRGYGVSRLCHSHMAYALLHARFLPLFYAWVGPGCRGLIDADDQHWLAEQLDFFLCLREATRQ
jgi:Glycosyl hydrolase catalytic core